EARWIACLTGPDDPVPAEWCITSSAVEGAVLPGRAAGGGPGRIAGLARVEDTVATRRAAPAVEGTDPARTASGGVRRITHLAGAHHAVAAHGEAAQASRRAPLTRRTPRRRRGGVTDFPGIDGSITARSASAIRLTAAAEGAATGIRRRGIALLSRIPDTVAARRAAVAAR